MLVKNIVLAVVAAAITASALPTSTSFTSPRTQLNTRSHDRTDVIYDGVCSYPEADDDFDLTEYLGKWYLVAGYETFYLRGSTCASAEYTLNSNSTVTVVNTARAANGQDIIIRGSATPVRRRDFGPPRQEPNDGDSDGFDDDNIEGYFNVAFPGQPGSGCPGPNYIVQKFEDDDEDDRQQNKDDDDEGWAIVQSGNFTTLSILSRERIRPADQIQKWINEAARLGSNVTAVKVFNQTNC